MRKLTLFFLVGLVSLTFTSNNAAAAQTVAICANNAASTAGGTWDNRANTLLHRAETAAAVLDNKLYVAGGVTGPGNFGMSMSASFEMYDPALDSWKELAPMPKPLHHVALASAKGHIYMTGGYSGLNFIPNNKNAWGYDPLTDTWAAVADMPAPRAAHTMTTINDVIYLVSGVSDASTALWTYDPLADKWNTEHQTMPTAREHAAAQAVDGKLYVIGGEVPNKNGTGIETYIRVNNNEVYDPATNKWATLAPMPTPRSSITAGVLGGKIHVISGENDQDICVFAQHEVYDPKIDQWSIMADMANPRHSTVSGVINGLWYVVGGATKPGFSTLSSLSNKVDVFKVSQAN